MRTLGTSSQPALNIPVQILFLSALLTLCFLASDILSLEKNNKLLHLFALFPKRYLGDWKSSIECLSALWSLVTYSLLHSNWNHLLFNVAWLVVFGSIVARFLGTARFFLFYFFCAFGAALVYILFNLESSYPAIGSSGAVFGLFGAMMRFLLPSNDQRFIRSQPCSLKKALQNRRALKMIAVFVGIDLMFAVGRGILGYDTVAWEAHLGGFMTGLLLFGWFAPTLRTSSGGPGRVDYGGWR